MTSDFDRFIATLRDESLFERGAVVTVARAPGRLDVMGGIADYSGSLVLQRPIAEARPDQCPFPGFAMVGLVIALGTGFK